MSPGVYSLYTTPSNEQQTQTVLWCILSAQRYRVFITPNESWGVFSLYDVMEWTTDPVSPGVYSACTTLYSGQHTQWVLGCILCLRRYGMISIRNESWGVFSLYDSTEWTTDPVSAGVYSPYTTLYSGQHTQWVLDCILSLGRYGMINIPNESWGVLSVYDAVEWRTDPRSPGVYSLYTMPWNEQQTQSVLGCILPAQRYIVVSTPNESWGVFSVYGATEWLAYVMSPGVYSLYMTPRNEQHTQSVLGCILPEERYIVLNTPNESWGVFSLYDVMEWTTGPVSPGVYSPCPAP